VAADPATAATIATHEKGSFGCLFCCLQRWKAHHRREPCAEEGRTHRRAPAAPMPAGADSRTLPAHGAIRMARALPRDPC